jgi:hypothetical protein
MLSAIGNRSSYATPIAVGATAGCLRTNVIATKPINVTL